MSERRLVVARTALHRAADLLESAHVEEALGVGEALKVDEALELVFLALEELDWGQDR